MFKHFVCCVCAVFKPYVFSMNSVRKCTLCPSYWIFGIKRGLFSMNHLGVDSLEHKHVGCFCVASLIALIVFLLDKHLAS